MRREVLGQARGPERALEGVLGRDVRHRTVGGREDPLRPRTAGERFLRGRGVEPAEHLARGAPEVHRAPVPALGRVDVAGRAERPLDAQLPRDQVQIGPSKRERLTQSQARPGEQEEQRVEPRHHCLGGREEPIQLRSVEGADSLLSALRGSREAHGATEAGRGVCLDHAVVHGRIQHRAQRSMDQAHRVDREAGPLLLGEERLDPRTVDLSNPQRSEGGEDVQLELFTIAHEAARLEARTELQPALRVLPHRHVGIHGRYLALPGGGQRAGESIFRVPPRIERLPPPAARGVPVVEDPPPAAPPDARHPVTALPSARA
jgi:hypothetical protein